MLILVESLTLVDVDALMFALVVTHDVDALNDVLALVESLTLVDVS